MPIPKFEEVKKPVLDLLSDGKIRSASDAEDEMAIRFQLSDEEKAELLPSGTARRFRNRVDWALYDLYRAGLFDKPSRGHYVISTIGKKVFAEDPKALDRAYLMQFPAFAEWIAAQGGKSKKKPGKEGVEPDDQTPEEIIEAESRKLDDSLADELLDLTRTIGPFRFEKLVIDLLLRMGYGGSRQEAGQATQKSSDGGIDGIINEDRLGLDAIYLQAKRWADTVGRKEIQSFVGALSMKQASKGVFITTSAFSKGARECAAQVPQKVVLIDGKRLAELMIEHGLGVTTNAIYEIRKLDTDYFQEG